MSAADYFLGLGDLAAVLGGVALSAILLIRGRFGEEERVARVLAFAVVATGVLVAVHVVPLALGVLTRVTVLAAVAATVLLAWRLAAGSGPGMADGREGPVARSRLVSAPAMVADDRAAPLSRALAVSAAGILAAASISYALFHAADPSTGVDMLGIHLPDVARWIQTRTLWKVNDFAPGFAHGNYPNNGDMVLLAGALPWRSDFLARLTMLPFLGVTALAVYGLAREVAAPATTATALAAVVCAVPIVAESAVRDALPDTVLLATYGAGLVFAARELRTGSRRDLVLAGVAFGLAAGTKWYGLPAVAVALVLWVALGTRSRPRATSARRMGVLVSLVTAGVGVWLARNWVESGNPFFPVRASLLGVTVWDAPPDLVRRENGFTVSRYLDEPGVWRHYLIPIYRRILDAPALLVGVGAAVALVMSAARREAVARAGVVALGLGAAVLGAVYLVTPYTAQGAPGVPVFAAANTRYLVPALMLGAAATAWLGTRGERWRLVIEALALGAVALGVDRSFDLGLPFAAAVIAGWALSALVLAALRIRRPQLRPPSRTAALAAAVVVVLLVAGAGYADQRAFFTGRYRHLDPTIDWLLIHAPSDRRIALVGYFSVRSVVPSLAAFGPRFDNEVDYLGRWDRGFLVDHRDRNSFLSALRRGSYDLLLVGRGADAGAGQAPTAPVAQERWALAAGLPVLARAATATLFDARPRR